MAALPATVFLSIVVGALGNFRCLFIFRGLVYICPFLRVCVIRVIYILLVLSCPYSPSDILRVPFYIPVLFIVYRYI